MTLRPIPPIAIAACFALAACGSGKDEIIFDTTLGPATKAQVKDLPPGLVGPEQKRRYTTRRQVGEGMTDGGDRR